MRGCYFIPLIISLVFILLGCAQPGAMPPTTGDLEGITEVEASDSILDYSQQSLWTEEKFSEMLADKAGFETRSIEERSKNMSTYGERGEYGLEANVESNEGRKSTVLVCKVCETTSKSGNSCHLRSNGH